MLDPFHLVIVILIGAEFLFGNPNTQEQDSRPKTEEIKRESKTIL